MRSNTPPQDIPLSFTPPVTGFCTKGSPTGPRLPPFSSRGGVGRDIPLNSILVNFAAQLRLRRLDRQSPGWRGKLHPDAQVILARVKSPHKAVTFGRDRPASPDLRPGPRVLPTMRWEDAQKLMHTGNLLFRLLGPTVF